jgi:integrase
LTAKSADNVRTNDLRGREEVTWLKARIRQDGTVQYTGMYRDIKNRERSAGTFPSKREALRAARRMESEVDAGRIGDRKRGRQTLTRYVRIEWLPNHVIEDSTRERYTYVINRHILPNLGTMRMQDIMPWHVRDWITDLVEAGVRPQAIRSAKVCLDAILSTAFHDQVTALHAGRGVKTPPVPRKSRTIITTAHYQRLRDALRDADMQLLVETDIETGLRWGELTELRPRDIDFSTNAILVSRVVIHLKSAEHSGPRFKVKEYPKDGEWRRVVIAQHLADKLRAHITHRELGADDLLFPLPRPTAPARRGRPAELPDPSTVRFTDPNEKGLTYRHGTLTAYQAGKCRCQSCRDAIADYRARRRATGKDSPRRPRVPHTDADRHMSNDWFRHNVWNPALTAADLGFRVTPHGLRHAHASWLLAGGADLQVVKERLGHGSITTTEKYLHTLPDAGQAALAALDKIRPRM